MTDKDRLIELIIGKKAPIRYFIILYMLSVVANLEEAKGGDNNAR